MWPLHFFWSHRKISAQNFKIFDNSKKFPCFRCGKLPTVGSILNFPIENENSICGKKRSVENLLTRGCGSFGEVQVLRQSKSQKTILWDFRFFFFIIPCNLFFFFEKYVFKIFSNGCISKDTWPFSNFFGVSDSPNLPLSSEHVFNAFWGGRFFS